MTPSDHSHKQFINRSLSLYIYICTYCVCVPIYIYINIYMYVFVYLHCRPQIAGSIYCLLLPLNSQNSRRAFRCISVTALVASSGVLKHTKPKPAHKHSGICRDTSWEKNSSKGVQKDVKNSKVSIQNFHTWPGQELNLTLVNQLRAFALASGILNSWRWGHLLSGPKEST